MSFKKILLSHGSGGKFTQRLIKELLLARFKNPILEELADSALINYRQRLAFTTDSFVVNPLFFPGGDIGKLAVCGTVNDLVMVGAVPEYLSLALIIEEGLDYVALERIVDSISATAKETGVSIVTGDFKVVEKGSCDKMFINTSGLGRVIPDRKISASNIEPGDRIIVTGAIAEHGLAVLARRRELDLRFNIKSDCASLNKLIIPLLQKTDAIKFMRDPTRGGLSTTLNEIAQACDLGILVNEKEIPLSAKVRAACELLGLDPLYIANEGKAIIVVSRNEAQEILTLLRRHPLARQANLIGEVVKEPASRVVLNTALKTQRFLDMLSSDPLPRIC
jgi:hydrogenase expression/formation protein HypE